MYLLRHSLLICIWAAINYSLPRTEAATEYNRYLAHIFQKYGSAGTMSFEGLEHLMYSLGLGQIEFEPTHTVEQHRPESYKDNKVSSDVEYKTYFGQQNIKTLVDEQDDAQILYGPLAHTIGSSNDVTDIDTIVREGDSNVLARKTKKMAPTAVSDFKEMHDPKHRHRRNKDASLDKLSLSSESICLSPKSLLRLVVNHEDLHKRKQYRTVATGTAQANTQRHQDIEEEYNDFINNVKLTPTVFMKLCPALLAQIDQHVCIKPAPLEYEADSKGLMWNAWIYASGSIFILSASGLLGLLVVPLMKSIAYQGILKFLVAVAAGTLSGDSLMHLLPHALVKNKDLENKYQFYEITNQQHSPDNSAVWICSCAFITAIFMYMIENILPLLVSISGTHHGHNHSHARKSGHSIDKTGNEHDRRQQLISKTDEKQPQQAPAIPCIDLKEVKEINVMLHESKKDSKFGNKPLTPIAFMVIIGDGLHNFTDGLAIGAAFALDPVTGLATALAVLFHELPHELGDFALLLQTGMTLKRAICLNIISSVLSFVGMAVGLLVAEVHRNMTQWIYAATSGSFLYIAFADLMPAMSIDVNSKICKMKDIILQIFGLMLGGLIMLLIAINESELVALFK